MPDPLPGGTKVPLRANISKRLGDRLRAHAARTGQTQNDVICFALAAGLDALEAQEQE